MVVLEFFRCVFGEGHAVAWCVGFGCLLLSGVTAYFFERADVYAALAIAIIGGVCIAAVVFAGAVTVTVVFGVASLTIVSGVLYLVLAAALAAKEKVRKRKREHEERGRKLQFTLPQKDNTFVRSRLNTTLNADMGASNEEFVEEKAGEKLRLEYANKLLIRVWNAPLSAADRLTAEDIAKTFSCCTQKESWSASDVRTVNELLSALLKLSAKYSV